MNCPVCNETLLLTNRQGVQIDHCPKCKGVWLDRGELEKIIELSNIPGNGVLQSTPPHITSTHPVPTPPHVVNPHVVNPHNNADYENADGPDYRTGHNDNYGYNKHADTSNGKKGFLGDLFDF